MKILIVDDHAIFRDGLRRILSDEFKAATFGDASNATEALDRVWKEKWDLVLLDITMHGRTGLDVLKEIRKSASDLPYSYLADIRKGQISELPAGDSPSEMRLYLSASRLF